MRSLRGAHVRLGNRLSRLAMSVGARAVATRVCGGDATGETDGNRCLGEPPSARYYLGSLAPADLDLAAGRERRGRETPRSSGFEFEVVNPRAQLEVRATVSCYYRVLPTLGEQLKDAGGELPLPQRVGRNFRLAPCFQRVEVSTGWL